MTSNDQKLAHYLKIKFGTSHHEPTEYQLQQIKYAIQLIGKTGTTPSSADWYAVVKKYCPSAGTHFYGGADTSDLVTLLQLATNK